MTKLVVLMMVCWPILLACKKNSAQKIIQINNQQFSKYWYSGKAEIASYNLKQSRYGEIHEGKAVLIFVTEPFSASKQVKLDNPALAERDKVNVLKLNFIKKFNTGIYPYSMMLSTFTPIADQKHPRTLKVTMSAQEWCGHVYSQMNLDDSKYDVRSFSYFEEEGDQQNKIDAAILEDEIWNRIRLNYKLLPNGNLNMIPGLFFTRLAHQNLKAQPALARLQESDSLLNYTISFESRTLSINFKNVFPYQITSWKETSEGIHGEQITSSAVLDKVLHIDYWTRNKKKDSYLRDSLNLK